MKTDFISQMFERYQRQAEGRKARVCQAYGSVESKYLVSKGFLPLCPVQGVLNTFNNIYKGDRLGPAERKTMPWNHGKT